MRTAIQDASPRTRAWALRQRGGMIGTRAGPKAGGILVCVRFKLNHLQTGGPRPVGLHTVAGPKFIRRQLNCPRHMQHISRTNQVKLPAVSFA